MDSMYDFSLTTFSPSGKLVQIEYALHAVASGSTAIGIKGIYAHPKRYLVLVLILQSKAKNGVVIATEKKLPVLMDQTSVQKVTLLTPGILRMLCVHIYNTPISFLMFVYVWVWFTLEWAPIHVFC